MMDRQFHDFYKLLDNVIGTYDMKGLTIQYGSSISSCEKSLEHDVVKVFIFIKEIYDNR